jgi:hypothetical protein
MTTAHRFRLEAPRVGEHEVEFKWDVTPRTELYIRTGFRLTFPPELELERVPEALWLRIAMICLHPQWALLAPCRVELPAYIGPAEREFWRRLTYTVGRQVRAYGGEAATVCPIEIHDDGPALRPVAIAAGTGRAAAAFSGGKDSLAQAGLLAELTERPLLVATTSPVPWANDHVGASRERVLSEIAERLPVDVIEVGSDFRCSWDNGFSERHGAKQTVNELTDVLLYQATTVAAAAASGIGRAFMASEAELQYNASAGGEVLQHAHSAAAAVTHGALGAMLRPFGLGLSSMTYALHTEQVQALVLGRYREIADLQFSCWSAIEGSQACGECSQCYEIAAMLLDHGLSPELVGIDPARVVSAWSEAPIIPPVELRLRLHPARRPRDKLFRIVGRTPVERVAEILAGDPGREQAVEAYARLRERVSAEPEPPPTPGFIAGFVDLLDDDLREGLRAIFADEGFTPSADPEHALMCKRSRSLTRWIADPLPV